MARILKLKYIFAVMIALILVASAAAFSVSYAKWTGGGDSLSAQVSTGVWETEQDDFTYGLTMETNGRKVSVDLQSYLAGDGSAGTGRYFVIKTPAGERNLKLRFHFNDVSFSVLETYNDRDYSDNPTFRVSDVNLNDGSFTLIDEQQEDGVWGGEYFWIAVDGTKLIISFLGTYYDSGAVLDLGKYA